MATVLNRGLTHDLTLFLPRKKKLGLATVSTQTTNLVRFAAVMSIVGIILNRLNVSTIAYNWYDHSLHFPTWMEFVVSAAVIFVQLLIFRWIVRRMPVYSENPKWIKEFELKTLTNNTIKKLTSWKDSA